MSKAICIRDYSHLLMWAIFILQGLIHFFFRPKLSGMMVNSYVCKRQESSSGAVHAHIEPKCEPHVHNNNNNVISVTVK